MNIMALPHPFFSMQMKIRTICRTTAIRTDATGAKERTVEGKENLPERIFLGNGSDEAIDLVFRAFCEPRIDNVVAIDYVGMYQVCAE